MTRGDIIAVTLPREYGKPRPAVVVQSDLFSHLNSVTVLPLTGEILDVASSRVTIEPSETNGLRIRSQIMVDKVSTVPRAKAGLVIGRLSDSEMATVNRALALFLGFA